MSAAQAQRSDVALVDVLPQHRFDEQALWRYLQAQLDDFSGPARAASVPGRSVESHVPDPDADEEVRPAEEAAGQAPAVGAPGRARVPHPARAAGHGRPGAGRAAAVRGPGHHRHFVLRDGSRRRSRHHRRHAAAVDVRRSAPASTTTTRASARRCTPSTFAPSAWAISASPKATSRASWIAGPSNTWRRRPKRTPTWSG